MDQSSTSNQNTGNVQTIRRAPTIEVIDLSTDSEDDEAASTDLARAGSPIRQQNETEDPRLSYLKCVICLDSPTDLTATTCGHLFCHECINAALKVTSATSGACPVCRRKVTIKSLIPLAIMKGPVLGADVPVPQVAAAAGSDQQDGGKETIPKPKARLAKSRNGH